jgi:hypothetical protein
MRQLGIALFALTTLALPAFAQRGDDADRPSKNGKTEGKIGAVTVTIEYGRPNVKSRKIWGDLVPYGKVWRTGANEATTITFDKDVTIEGKPLAAGTYALFTIPTEDKWTWIFNKTAKQWGAFKYDQAQDALRVEVEPAVHEPVEEMTFLIQDDKVILRWEKRAVEFHVAAAG